MTYSDPEYVKRQYRDASNLNARLALHDRFSTNPYGLQHWIFDQFEPPDEASILEVGCGPGSLWTENLERIPEGWSITLTDVSPGMVSEAEARLGPDQRFEFRVADAQALPFEADSFDAVVANHMLYHVPDRAKAFSEIARLLKPGGILYAATNGAGHMRETGRLKQILDSEHPTDAATKEPLGFDLGNGAEQLSRWFSYITLRRYEDALVVTEVKPLVEYLLSGPAADTTARGSNTEEFDRRVSDLTEQLERDLASRGAIHITKDTGLFVARK